MGLKRPLRRVAGQPRGRFRRTLVGLKLLVLRHRVLNGRPGFRRTLVGLKHGRGELVSDVAAGFRRTLVGLKHPSPRSRPSPTPTFQKDPCGVEAPTNR